MSTVIYHNPRCSKSRAALALLREHGEDPVIVEYLRTPPGRDTIESLLDALDLEPRAIMRHNESEYGDLGLDDPALTHAQLVAALQQTPRLLQRPIVVRDGRAVVARPPELLLELFR